MFKFILIPVLIVAVSVALLAVRLLCGKRDFVSAHVDDNEALAKKGICCAKEQDETARRQDGLCIKEHQS